MDKQLRGADGQRKPREAFGYRAWQTTQTNITKHPQKTARLQASLMKATFPAPVRAKQNAVAA